MTDEFQNKILIQNLTCYSFVVLQKSTGRSSAPPDVSRLALKRILDKIDNIINEAHRVLPPTNLPGYTRTDKKQIVSSSSRSAVTTATPPPVLIGRDKDRDDIIAMLHENVGDIQPGSGSIIGIHGIAGSGKSTLAQLVCASEKNDKKKADHFDLIMWVHVSQNFRVRTILTEMLEAATGKQCDNLNNIDILILQQNLEGRTA